MSTTRYPQTGRSSGRRRNVPNSRSESLPPVNHPRVSHTGNLNPVPPLPSGAPSRSRSGLRRNDGRSAQTPEPGLPHRPLPASGLDRRQAVLRRGRELLQQFSAEVLEDLQRSSTPGQSLAEKLRNKRLELQQLREKKKKAGGRFHRRSTSINSKAVIKRLQRKVADQNRALSSLRERLSEQSRQALQLDGHFQVIDDSKSRDKLVKSYKMLYDEVDVFSQTLEEAFPLHQDTIERNSGAFFVILLEGTFRDVEEKLDFLLKLTKSTADQCLLVSQDKGPQLKLRSNVRSTSDQGLMSLLKVLLSSKTTAKQAPDDLVEKVVERAKDQKLHKLLASASSHHQGSRSHRQADGDVFQKVILEFAKKVVAIAWNLMLLPASARSDSHGRVEFFPDRYTRHSISNPKSTKVEEVFWPALVDDKNVCLCKGVVRT